MNEPFEPFTTPVEVVPSPQSIIAVKSLATLAVLLSVNVATGPPNGWPGMMLIGGWFCCGVGVSTSVSLTVTGPPTTVSWVWSAVRTTTTVGVKLPSSV